MDNLAEKIRPDDSALAEWCQSYLRNHKARFALDVELTNRYVPKGSRILEVGSVPPFLTAALREDFQIIGVDIDPGRFGGTIRDFGLDVRACNIETDRLPFDDQYFDCVIFNEIFEHLRLNPITTMREIRRVLKPGGLLTLSTPNLRSGRGIFNLLFRGRGQAIDAEPFKEYSKLEQLGHMGHVREYTPREVRDFLSEVGFTVENIIYRGAKLGPERVVCRVIPSLQPYMSLICRAI